MRTVFLLLASVMVSQLFGAIPTCPAGMPLGSLRLNVQRGDTVSPLPLHRINRIEEGDRITYEPVLRPKEKRPGEVAVVLVAAIPDEEKFNFTVLDTKSAEKPAEWTSPFRATLAMYVYGPSGLSTRKLKGFLAKDQELITQLADYAEKTAQTEAVLQALTQYDNTGSSESVSAALQGFAGQYGINAKIDRNAPMNEQTLDLFRRLNPALAAYDPISPSPAQRMGQTASLAATVAGMFLGSTVGLAAGGTALALNLKSIAFPEAEFRSAYSQSATNDAVPLCATRDARQSRKQLGYLWAVRIPDARVPAMKVDEPATVAPGLKLSVRVDAQDPKLVGRVRDWKLRSASGDSIPVTVTNTSADPRTIDMLVPASLAAGNYKLIGMWDWEPLEASGEIRVESLSDFSKVRIAPESQNRLRPGSGKQVLTLQGADFQFVDKVSLVKSNDKFASPIPLAFNLAKGQRRGIQSALDVQVDTGSLSPGDYTFLLAQNDGKPHNVPVKVLQDPPQIENLPLVVHAGESESEWRLRGKGIDRITGFEAEGMEFQLRSDGSVRVTQKSNLPPGAVVNLRMLVQEYAAPIVLTNAVRVAGPRPKILSAAPSEPPELPIALLPQELPAGVQIGVLLRTTDTGVSPRVELRCKASDSGAISVQAGAEKSGVKAQQIQAGNLFVSFDPGLWPSGCSLTASVSDSQDAQSEPFSLGKVVRLPTIDSFKLTDEAAGAGAYFGVLTGSDLELIGKVGWTAESANAVAGLPAPLAGAGSKQSLKVQLPWPSPTPHSPLFIWFRGEEKGRPTRIRY